MKIVDPAAVAQINLFTSWEQPGVHLPVYAAPVSSTFDAWGEALSAAVRLSDGAAGAQGIFMRERDGVRSFELRALETVDFTMATATLGTARRGLELLGTSSSPSVRDTTGQVVSSSGSVGSDTGTQPKRTRFGLLLALVDGAVQKGIEHQLA